ncbi:MAG: hypothetical protein WCF84_20085 [Anaerolineae bacterium]
MKSRSLPSFWAHYASLAEDVKSRARKAYRLWSENPYHPSLQFKCINREENIWSARVTRGYRAIGFLEGDTVTWFWIGGHDEYERFLS